MHIHTSLLFFLLPTAFAAQHVVELGEDGFVFVPDTVQAAVGDTVVFEFFPGGHSVAQSNFNAPCSPAPGGIWSGFFNPSSGKDTSVWVITIADTNPIWLYCAQIGHCNAGMAMVINPPSGGNTLAAYKSAAANAKAATPQQIEGGVVTALSAVTSAAESSTSAAESSTSSASMTLTPTTTAPATTSSTSTAESSTSSASMTLTPTTTASATTSSTSTAESSTSSASMTLTPTTTASATASTLASTTAPATFTGGASRKDHNQAVMAVAVMLGAGVFAGGIM